MFFVFFSLGGHLPEGGIFCISKLKSDFFRLSPGLLSFRRCKGNTNNSGYIGKFRVRKGSPVPPVKMAGAHPYHPYDITKKHRIAGYYSVLNRGGESHYICFIPWYSSVTIVVMRNLRVLSTP